MSADRVRGMVTLTGDDIVVATIAYMATDRRRLRAHYRSLRRAGVARHVAKHLLGDVLLIGTRSRVVFYDRIAEATP